MNQADCMQNRVRPRTILAFYGYQPMIADLLSDNPVVCIKGAMVMTAAHQDFPAGCDRAIPNLNLLIESFA